MSAGHGAEPHPDVPEYPVVQEDEVARALGQPYPAWFLDPAGDVRAANALAAWLWTGGQIGALLNANAFDVFAWNRTRIDTRQNQEFYKKKTAVLKRVARAFGEARYGAFITAMTHDHALKEIYDWWLELPDREWVMDGEWMYPLRIVRPGATEPLTAEDVLAFQVTISRLPNDAGFLAVDVPVSEHSATSAAVAAAYRSADAARDVIAYVQHRDHERRLLPRQTDGHGSGRERGVAIEPDLWRHAVAETRKALNGGPTVPRRPVRRDPEQVQAMIERQRDAAAHLHAARLTARGTSDGETDHVGGR